MCGIAGWLDWERDLTEQRTVIERMGATLQHRGPDGSGTWVTPRVGLAHRRLAVIDPAGGAQPMHHGAGDRAWVVACNGEIYNYRELRAMLSARGHSFRTQSDTEVLLHAYAEWGEEAVGRLNGIFAFALWDEQQQLLLLARDHLGVKPLFYAQPRPGALLFGSEIKALLAHPDVGPDVGTEGLAELFAYGPVRSPGSTIYCHIREVQAAHTMTFTREGCRVRRYWSLRSARHSDDLPTTVVRVRELLEGSVGRQLTADVPVVAMLSGGLDSSGVAALAVRARRDERKMLRTYAVDYADSARYFTSTEMQPDMDAPWAARVAACLGTQHHVATVEIQALLDNILVATRARDAPGLGQLDTSLYLLCRAMKPAASVALSGEGADEVFGGYPWFHHAEALDTPTFPWLAAYARPGVGQQYLAWLSADAVSRVQPEAHIAACYEQALAEVPRLEGESGRAARRREMFYMLLTRWLPVLLERKDRLSMATGVEIRVPYCDYRLVEYVWNVPWEFHVADRQEKGLLRLALADLVPDDVRLRPKSAYPVSQHPAYLAGLRHLVLDLLHDPNAAARPLLNVPMLRAVAAGRIPAVTDQLAAGLFERVVQLNAWLTQYRVRVC